MNIASISKLLLICLVCVAGGCMPAGKGGDEEGSASGKTADSLTFDPLGLKADNDIVPERFPSDSRRRGETVTPQGQEANGQEDGDESGGDGEPVGGQVFKVQVLSSKLFGEARQALRVAEEIFDQPVSMDYEVPYFKVRVGNFSDRYEAERYSQRVRAAGYSDAWVVAAVNSVRKAAPMYQDGSQPPVVGDTTNAADTSSAGKE